MLASWILCTQMVLVCKPSCRPGSLPPASCMLQLCIMQSHMLLEGLVDMWLTLPL